MRLRCLPALTSRSRRELRSLIAVAVATVGLLVPSPVGALDTQATGTVDLIVRVDSYSYPAVDGHLRYEVTLTNQGPDAAHDVTLTATFDEMDEGFTTRIGEGLHYLSDTSGLPHTGTGNGPVVWELGMVPAGVVVSFDLFAEVVADLDSWVALTIEVATSSTVVEPATTAFTSGWQVQPNGTSLTVAKHSTTDRPSPDGSVVYDLVVCNTGSTASGTLSLTDTLDPDTVLTSWWSPTPGWIETARTPTNLQVQLPALDGAACSTIRAGVHVAADVEAGQWLQNTLTVTGGNDLDLSDNTVTHTHIVEGGATITGTVFHDRDGDGVRVTGEEGVGGVGVVLTQSGIELAVSTTDPDGRFGFPAVPHDTYVVEPDSARLGGHDATWGGIELTVSDGETRDVSLRLYDAAVMVVRPFVDADGTTTYSPDDQCVPPDTEVRLVSTWAEPTDQQIGDDCMTVFDGLAPGDYRVEVGPPDGYEPVTNPDPDVSIASGDIEIVDIGFRRSVALDPGVDRWAGPDRAATAAAVSEAAFGPGIGTVFVATALNFPDALAGGPAAAVADAPILLVTTDAVPEPTAAELVRLAPERIVVLGGPAAVGDGVVSALGAYTDGPVVRWAGPDRYATAAEISARTFGPQVATVFVATGTNFPDALAGGPAAARLAAPVLLVTQDTVPEPTGTEIDRVSPVTIVVLGGPAVVNDTVLDALDSRLG